jgi:hypothetical protein
MSGLLLAGLSYNETSEQEEADRHALHLEAVFQRLLAYGYLYSSLIVIDQDDSNDRSNKC